MKTILDYVFYAVAICLFVTAIADIVFIIWTAINVLKLARTSNLNSHTKFEAEKER